MMTIAQFLDAQCPELPALANEVDSLDALVSLDDATSKTPNLLSTPPIIELEKQSQRYGFIPYAPRPKQPYRRKPLFEVLTSPTDSLRTLAEHASRVDYLATIGFLAPLFPETSQPPNPSISDHDIVLGLMRATWDDSRQAYNVPCPTQNLSRIVSEYHKSSPFRLGPNGREQCDLLDRNN